MFISIVPYMLGYLDPAHSEGAQIKRSAPEQVYFMLCSILFYNFIIGSYWIEVVN